MSNFKIFLDKENNSQTAVANPANGSSIRSTRVGKSFQTPLRTGPRRALGDVNAENINSGKNSKNLDVSACKEAALKHLHSKIMQKAKKELVQEDSKSLQKEKIEVQKPDTKEENFEEIEFMLPYDEEKEDDFEDIWPRIERPAEYMEKFRKWRPSNIFPTHNSPDCSEEPDGYLSDTESEDEPIRDYSFDGDLPSDFPLDEIKLPDLDLSDDDLPHSDLFAQLAP